MRDSMVCLGVRSIKRGSAFPFAATGRYWFLSIWYWSLGYLCLGPWTTRRLDWGLMKLHMKKFQKNVFHVWEVIDLAFLFTPKCLQKHGRCLRWWWHPPTLLAFEYLRWGIGAFKGNYWFRSLLIRRTHWENIQGPDLDGTLWSWPFVINFASISTSPVLCSAY